MTRKNLVNILLASSTAFAVSMVWLVGVNHVQASTPHSDSGCVRCHLPHNAVGDGSANPMLSVPLWNPIRSHTVLTTDTYSGTTVRTKDPGPTGASVVCLSCHDGTSSGVWTRTARMFGAAGGMGTLQHTHPISVVYDASLVASGKLKDPATTPALKFAIDGNGKVQCTSCHTPHTGQQDHRLRWVYDDANVGPTSLTFCNTCHNK